MKIFSLAALALSLLASSYSATLTTVNHDNSSVWCTLTGTYENGTDVSACNKLEIKALSVPAGVQLDLTNVTDGAHIEFTGTTTFGTSLWSGPLILLTGNNLKVNGPGTLDGNGSWYWPYGQSVTRPVFFRLIGVNNSKLSDFKIKNMPFRTFSIQNCNETLVTGLTIDSSAGDNTNPKAKNTDGFDLSYNNGVTITRNKIFNQDDCLAMQSSNNTVFSHNTCSGGHGISIGSLGGTTLDYKDIVNGLTVTNNKIINNSNGIRIKTIIDLYGQVSNVVYKDNELTNVTNAIVMHSDYNKTAGGYSGLVNSLVTITNITVDGLTGTATNKYDILVNPAVVSNWTFKNVNVNATTLGSCVGEPSTVSCLA